MTVREDANKRAEAYDRDGNYFLADLIRASMQIMSEDLLDREIEEED